MHESQVTMGEAAHNWFLRAQESDLPPSVRELKRKQQTEMANSCFPFEMPFEVLPVSLALHFMPTVVLE